MRTRIVVCATNSESNCRLGFDESKVDWALNIRKLTAPHPPPPPQFSRDPPPPPPTHTPETKFECMAYRQNLNRTEAGIL